VTLRVRLASATDLPAVSALLVRVWHDTYDAIYGVEKVNEITSRWHSVSNLIRQLQQPLSLSLVAEKDGQILGTSQAIGQVDGSVHLGRLYIAPEAQRGGVGAVLLTATEQAFPFASRITLEVEPQNTRATAFYRKHSFEIAGSTADCGGSSGIAADKMQKVLSPSAAAPIMLRPVCDTDAQDLIGLITLCFAEYPGCVFDPHDDMPDIVRPAQSRLATEGVFLAVEDETGRVCACVGVDFPKAGVAELHRLYVRPDMRGRGLAKLLTARMEDKARQHGAGKVILWSDTRFTKAHQLYRSLGYQQAEISRSLGDISQSREFLFEKAL
jgi:GNAT superfamily N-acetyltransferase